MKQSQNVWVYIVDFFKDWLIFIFHYEDRGMLSPFSRVLKLGCLLVFRPASVPHPDFEATELLFKRFLTLLVIFFLQWLPQKVLVAALVFFDAPAEGLRF